MPSRTLLTLLVFLPCSVQALFGSSNETDFWDDFANNFATDLAPIISLFGEQVTKQFLSESTTILDTIIFAVGPLGIITAIVSCIRVSGSSFLKSVVGRAREPHGVPEIELCSSTSESVCELWSNGGICRVFGRPKILEFIFCKPDEEDFYAVYDDEGGEERPATCGVFLNRDELKRALNPSVGSDPLGQENTATSSRTSRSGWKAVSSRETLFSKWLPWKFVHETSGSGSLRTTNATETAETATPPSWLADVLARAIGRTGSNTSYYEAPPSSLDIESGNMNHSNEEVEETKAPGDEDHRQFAPFPNLALNIGVQEAPISIWILWLGSVFGVLLQSSFFGYATWATWYHPAFYEGGKVPNTPPLFFTFTMVGTTFIVLGMGLCATIIDRSSKDQRFVPLCPKGTENLGRRIFWFQPAQHIGDQEFAAFLCNERKKEYVASWNDKTVPTSTLPVWLGVGLSFVGWVVQFIGLRGQHATVSLYQLGCTIIMSIIRASIRASRSAPKNQLENPSKGLQGHELDWQALRLASECLHQEGPGVNSDQEDKRRSFRSQIRHWFGGQIHRSSSAQETKSNSLDPTKPELLFDTDIEDELKEKVHWVIDSFQSERICERSTDYARMKIRKNLAVVIRSDRDWAERTRKLVWCIESCDLELQEILTKLEDGKSTPGSPNMATKWIRIRARLAHLTKRLRPYQSWEDDTRKVALQLKAVLEKSSELLYPHPDSSWRQTTTLVWSMSFRLWVDEASTVQEMPICFFMVRTGKVWNIDENQLVAVLSVWSWAVARYISSLNRDPDEWFSTQQRKTVAGKIEELHFIRRVLGLWDEFEDISPLFDSGRFVRTNLSVPSMTSGLGGIISRSELMPEPDYRVGCWSIPGTSSLMQLMAQDLFTTFIETVGTLRLGYLEDVTILNTGRSENKKIIENMVRLLASEGLATRKEAIMSVIPALCPRHESNNSIRRQRLLFSEAILLKRRTNYREPSFGEPIQHQTTGFGVLVWDLPIRAAMDDEPTSDFHQWRVSQQIEVHIDVIYWLLWSKRVTQTFDYGPKFPFKDSSVLRKLQPPFEARALLDEKTLDDLKLDNVVPGDTKSQRDAFEQALTLDQRFKLGESEPEVRKQLLRWAIEWDCTDLIEDLWYAERNRPWVESAFSSGCDELFWAVSLRSHTHDMINTILVLLEVVEIDLSAPLKCRDDMDQSWWAASRKRDLIKRQYEQGHNVLGAAFANPNGLEVAALLLDKRSWSYDLASEDICKTVSAAIQYGSLEIVDGLMTKVVEKECDCGDGMFELLLLLVQWGLADWVKHMLQTHERFLAGPMCLDSALRVAKIGLSDEKEKMVEVVLEGGREGVVIFLDRLVHAR